MTFVDRDSVLVDATSRVRNRLLAGGFKPERRWFFEFLIPLVLSSACQLYVVRGIAWMTDFENRGR
jgi:hypothetical protein